MSENASSAVPNNETPSPEVEEERHEKTPESNKIRERIEKIRSSIPEEPMSGEC